MKANKPTAKDLDQYAQDVAQKVFDKLPKSVVNLLGLTVEEVKNDLESTLNGNGDLVAKYSTMKYTTDRCWEEDCSIDQCVDKIFGEYERVLIQ